MNANRMPNSREPDRRWQRVVGRRLASDPGNSRSCRAGACRHATWCTRRGSVLVIVMVTLLFATFALITFIEKAMNDLLVEQREADDRRLRLEAYSALEVTLAVLEDFRAVSNGLHSPAEGWSDPLAFAGYVPTNGRTVEVAFADESGKISLPRVNAVQLTTLFRNWDILQQDSEGLADALMGWMHKNHVATSGVPPDYEHAPLPFEPPGRSLRSFHELAAIDRIREFFFDPEGRPNDYWRRFVDSVSLLDFERANLNGARPDALAALGQFDLIQQQNVNEFLTGTGPYQFQGPGYFRNTQDALQLTGPSGDTRAFGTTISALRIIVTVREGISTFRLAAIIAPPNGATTVQTTATAQRTQTTGAGAQANARRQNQRNQQQQASARQANSRGQAGAAGGPPAQAGTEAGSLRYPFTLLEIRENDEIPTPPPASSEGETT